MYSSFAPAHCPRSFPNGNGRPDPFPSFVFYKDRGDSCLVY